MASRNNSSSFNMSYQTLGVAAVRIPLLFLCPCRVVKTRCPSNASYILSVTMTDPLYCCSTVSVPMCTQALRIGFTACCMRLYANICIIEYSHNDQWLG